VDRKNKNPDKKEKIMAKEIKGIFTEIDGQPVYKIENYDQMENFFMTITSS